YNDLKRESKTEVVFDWNEILNMEGNSGPYLQYTYARIQSVLGKSKKKTFDKFDSTELNEDETNILRVFIRYSEVIEAAAKNYSPNILCNYLYLLAQKYNGFYNKHKIVGGENEDFKLTLTASTGQILGNGLKLLGIKAPDRM
ncbi:MAG: DALR anticodon-binding domain-containing protein, partial [Microgenomates group bacterium]